MAGVLVLDMTYTPVEHVSFEDAVLKMVRDKAIPAPGATIIAVYKSPSTWIEIPSILLLSVYVPVYKRMNKYYSKKMVFARDQETCQYCDRKREELGHDEYLTIDHVIPVSRWKNPKQAHTWENVTTACNKCNNIKDNRRPEECGMYPKHAPYKPAGVLITLYKKLDEEQKEYLRSQLNMAV